MLCCALVKEKLSEKRALYQIDFISACGILLDSLCNQNSCDVQHLIPLFSLSLSPSVCLSLPACSPVCLLFRFCCGLGQHPHCMLEFIKRITNANPLPKLTHFPIFLSLSLSLFGACLAIISNHILTFMPARQAGSRSCVCRHCCGIFLKRLRHFTNFIKSNEIKMPQTAAWRQAAEKQKYKRERQIGKKKDRILPEMDLSLLCCETFA